MLTSFLMMVGVTIEATSEEIRIEIAQLRGWTIADALALRGVRPGGASEESLPDFPGSLDACREFEDALEPGLVQTYSAYVKFFHELERVNQEGNRDPILFASAHCRCLAFLLLHRSLPHYPDARSYRTPLDCEPGDFVLYLDERRWWKRVGHQVYQPHATADERQWADPSVFSPDLPVWTFERQPHPRHGFGTSPGATGHIWRRLE